VEINIYGDNETGTGNTVALCQSYWAIHLGLSGWCCPDPMVTVTQTGSCANPALVVVDPVSTNSSDTFNVVLYDDSLQVVGYSPNVTTTAGFSNVLPGDYLIEAYNVSTTCISFHQLHIEEAFEIDLAQTVVGCGPNSSSVVANVTGPGGPFTYVWPNITTYTDSLAFNLSEGYQSVTVTDAGGCSLSDSIYVLQLSPPGAMFGYGDISYCHNDDTIQVYYPPFTPGGTFQLISPAASGITVDASTGVIALNSTTQTPPYFIYVEYIVGSANCTDSFVDSVQIVQQPSAPVASSPVAVDWCISNTPPMHSIAIAAGFPLWYDVQTTQTGIGYTFTPTLGSNTVPGSYLYGVVYLADITGNCSSWPTLFTVNAIPSPNFLISAGDTICSGDTAFISATGSASYSYTWSPAPVGGPQNTAQTFTSPAATTTYSVTVADGVCQSSQTLTVVVDPACTSEEVLTVYSGLTPNNDGFNDIWIIDGADSLPDMTVHIYNRWGYQVWKRTDYNNNTVVFRGDDDAGNPLPSGTYYYVILQDSFEPMRGWIELTR
jgi:gliding motility-associated-like protein